MEAVHLRHFDVQQNRGVISVGRQLQALIGVVALPHVKSLAGEDASAALANRFFVVHDQK